MDYSIGIDIGTFESKGVLVDGNGTIIASAARPHEMIVPRPGWAEHRPEEDWWNDFVAICQALFAQSGVPAERVRAVACSGIGPCMLPVDREGAPLMNAVLYGVDTRAAAEIEHLNAKIGTDRIFRTCGNALTSQSVGPKILWLKNNRPEIFARTDKLLTCGGFLVRRLTGCNVIDHFTAANFSPLYDVNRQDWTGELAGDIVDPDLLPELKWSDEIVGEVTKEAARATGLAPGTPVTTGTIDAAAEALSVGVTRPGDMMMMYGSTIFIIQVASKKISDPRLWYAPWLFEGEHAMLAGLATSGTLTHWFRDQLARDLDPATAFARLAAEAEQSPPGARGLLLLPYFSGERTPIHDPHARGSFFGLDLTHTRGDMYRALIEGIAYGTRHVTDTFGELGQAPERLLAVGGGTKNRLWLQATSDITGIEQIVCAKTAGASYGNAFLAFLALGTLEKDAIGRWNPAERTIAVNDSPAYRKNYRLFRAFYEQTRDIAAQLGE